MKTLILGGVKSGKSKLAEEMAGSSEQNDGLQICYVATATIGDEEMQARIDKHRAQRPQHWALIEEPIYLGRALEEHAHDKSCLLLDCLTLWITNLLCAEDEDLLQEQLQSFLDVLTRLPGQIILVGNETNMGIMPMGKLSRRYCDEVGMLHQKVAAICERVILTVAGLPTALKGSLP